MTEQSPVMAVLAHENGVAFANEVAHALGYTYCEVVMGRPRDAVPALSARSESPRYFMIDIGNGGHEILPELDTVAEFCDSGTHVIVIGTINDVSFYRELRKRGVLEYFTHPANAADVKNALAGGFAADREGKGKVISFMSAAAADGASTIALNTAYALATEYRKSVVLVDMDYQFGMVAKNLDLATPFGIKELFEHPDRGIDATLIHRMIATYEDSRLKVIAAPSGLHPLPNVPTELMRDLITTLRREYDIIILDLPHLWTPWVSAALGHADHAVMVAQLWLRSVTHCSRLLSVWHAQALEKHKISLVVNRSGAKFKEAISAHDFERICGHPIQYYFVNDIKSVVAAENHGKTLLQVVNSPLARQFKEFAGVFDKDASEDSSGESARSSVKSGNKL